MLESHLVADFCIIGAKGCGKSTTVERLAEILGYQIEPIVLYQASDLEERVWIIYCCFIPIFFLFFSNTNRIRKKETSVENFTKGFKTVALSFHPLIIPFLFTVLTNSSKK